MQAHERSYGPAKRRLLQALDAGKVRSRGHAVYGEYGEREWFTDDLNTVDLWENLKGVGPPKVDWADASAELAFWHPFGPAKIYKLEFAWDDLAAIWPAKPARRLRRPTLKAAVKAGAELTVMPDGTMKFTPLPEKSAPNGYWDRAIERLNKQ